MDVVNSIAETRTDYSDRPLEDQRIKTMTVETFGMDYPEPEKNVSYSRPGSRMVTQAFPQNFSRSRKAYLRSSSDNSEPATASGSG